MGSIKDIVSKSLGTANPHNVIRSCIKALSKQNSMFDFSSGTVPLQAYLLLASILFCIGVWGLINSRNAVRVLMSIELMLNAVNINLMAFSSFLDGNLIRGQVFTVFVITVAAAEAAVGLAILLSLYRNRVTVDMESFNLLRW